MKRTLNMKVNMNMKMTYPLLPLQLVVRIVSMMKLIVQVIQVIQVILQNMKIMMNMGRVWSTVLAR